MLANNVDPEGDAITKAEVLVGPANGTVVMNTDGSFTYTSNPSFIGSDAFTYMAFDALGASDMANVSINVIDAPPEPTEDAFAVGVDSPQVFIDVLKNDRDPEGKPLEVFRRRATQQWQGNVH